MSPTTFRWVCRNKTSTLYTPHLSQRPLHRLVINTNNKSVTSLLRDNRNNNNNSKPMILMLRFRR